MAANVLIIGDAGGFGEALARRLVQIGSEATMETGGSDSTIAARLGEAQWTAVVILTHDDALALRLTLLGTQVRPDMPLWVSIFDRTIVHQLHKIAPSVNVLPTAEIVARELADQCEQLGASHSSSSAGVRVVDDALRLMVIAGTALLLMLVVQIAVTIAALHEDLINALYYSTRALATVADAPRSQLSPDWFKLVSTVTTVASVVMVAVFTAALVRRLSRPRLTTLFGSRRVPWRHHVLLIGFGQIGFRLAQELRDGGIPVVALERDVDAPCVRLARHAGIPVAIGRGDDREILELLGIRRCAVVAAVTSDDLANVSIGLAANDVRPEMPLVLRLGDGDVAAETESLLHLGRICDAHAADRADARGGAGGCPQTARVRYIRVGPGRRAHFVRHAVGSRTTSRATSPPQPLPQTRSRLPPRLRTLPLLARGQLPLPAGPHHAGGVRVTAPAVIALREQQHVLAERRQLLAAERASVCRRLAVLRATGLPPARRAIPVRCASSRYPR